MMALRKQDRHVCVIGGGIAGISAAWALLGAGVKVTLLERSARLGGKIQSWTESGRSLEHGVHGFWPCYTHFFTLCREAGIPVSEAFVRASASALVYPDGTWHRVDAALEARPGLFFLGRWLLDTPGLTLADVGSSLRVLHRFASFKYPEDYFGLDHLSFAEFLQDEDVSDRFRRIVLEPFVLSLFFSASENISAGAVMAALQVYVLADREASIPKWLRIPPAEALFDRFAAALEKAGCNLVLSAAAKELGLDGTSSVTVTYEVAPGESAGDTTIPAANVVANSFAAVGEGGDYYLGRWADGLRCFSRTCTHMGCTVEWLPDANAFVCPCHHGRYDDHGTVVQGPPVAPLAPVHVEEQGGSVTIPVGSKEASFDAILIAGDLQATRAVLSASGVIGEKLAHTLAPLDTTPVIVVRLWFDPFQYDPQLWQAGLVLEMPFIDNYFILNSFSDFYNDQGLVIEVQNYRTKRWIDRPDNELVAIAVTDLRKFFSLDAAPRSSSVQRHAAVFTRYGPTMARRRPRSGRMAQRVYVAGDWTEPGANCWMSERATVTGLRAAADILTDLEPSGANGAF